MFVVVLGGFSLLIALCRTAFNDKDSLLDSGTCVVNTEAGLERLALLDGAENFLAVERTLGTDGSALRRTAVKKLQRIYKIIFRSA